MGPPRNQLLIIFYRNPKMGTVKTRLAATLGDEKALAIFRRLAQHTNAITKGLAVDKVVYYSDSIEPDDIWLPTIYRKSVQTGTDLGEKMKNAFAEGFEAGYEMICIIGTDCHELSGPLIEKALDLLRSSDTVIGPARDGGYYLLGMRRLYPELFTNKQWSTETVAGDTIHEFELLELKYSKLPTLRDVDREDDVPAAWI